MVGCRVLAAALGLILFGCARIPGKTGTEQAETIESLVERTLADLHQQYPETKDDIAKSVGYVIMNNKITKIPVVGAGTGYGVAINRKTEERTYLRMSRFDFGAGWGARSLRPVLLFHDEEKFKQFIDGVFQATFGAEASAKVGETGAAGGAGSQSVDKGYTSYLITDAGVSATASLGFVRVKPVRLKK